MIKTKLCIVVLIFIQCNSMVSPEKSEKNRMFKIEKTKQRVTKDGYFIQKDKNQLKYKLPKQMELTKEQHAIKTKL